MPIDSPKSLYSDIDFRFVRDKQGRLKKVLDIDSVEQSIDTILLTPLGSRKFNPEFGSRLTSIIFEPLTMALAIVIKNEVIRAINRWDPRIIVDSVNAIPDPDNQIYNIVIKGRFKGLNEFTYARRLSSVN